MLIGAAAMMITGAAIGFLAPSLSEAPPFVTDDVAAAAAAIAGNPAAWGWANALILAAALLTALGLVPITIGFHGPGRPWAWTGLVAFVLAAVFETINRLVSIGVTTWAAELYPDETVVTVLEAFERVGFGDVFYVLGFLAIGIYGIAMSVTDGAKGPGSAFVVVSPIGILVHLFGGSIPAFVFLATAALGGTTWFRGDAPSREGASRPTPSSSSGMDSG